MSCHVFPDRPGLGDQQYRWAVSVGWRVEPVASVSSADLPAFVVESEVVVFAQQHTALEVSTPARRVMVDVVGFAPGRWSFASGPEAPPVADREGDPLVAGEQPLLPPEIEHIAERIQKRTLGAVGAGEGLHGADRERVSDRLCKG